MKRPRWIAFTAQDGHSIGLDSEGRGFELRSGELARVPDPPAADRRRAGVETTKSPRRRAVSKRRARERD
jgi:hypothetical protein